MAGEQRTESAVVAQKTYDLLPWLLPRVEKFPRSFRFSVGDRLVAVGLNLLLPTASLRNGNQSLQSAWGPGRNCARWS